MRIVLAILSAIGIAACAVTPSIPDGFTTDDFFVIAMDYAGRSAITGVSAYGPTHKDALCNQATAAVISQSATINPKGIQTVGTCLHVTFRGPLTKHGAVIIQPSSGALVEFVKVAVMYSRDGTLIGSQAMSPASDAKACKFQSQDTIDSNVKEGKVPDGDSLLIYCVPVPVLPKPDQSRDGSETL